MRSRMCTGIAIMVSCICLLLPIAAPVGASPVSSPAMPSATSLAHPYGTYKGPNPLVLWAPTMGGGPANQTLTLAQALVDAKTYDLIVGLPNTFKRFLGQMHAANPKLKMIVYTNGIYLDKKYGPNAFPANWYEHDASGNLVEASNWATYLMNPLKEGWVHDRIQNCRTLMAGGWDGCYLDNIGPGSFVPGYLTSAPIDTATGQPWTPAQWVQATSAEAKEVQTSLPHSLIVINGINNGYAYTTPRLGPTSLFFGNVKYGNAQGWLRTPRKDAGTVRGTAHWLDDVNLLGAAGANGDSVLTFVKVWGKATVAQAHALHRYALASFLLATDGNDYFYFNSDGTEAAQPQDYIYDRVNVGMPTGSYQHLADGLYTRNFVNGFVVVNPNSFTVTMSLGGTYEDLQQHLVSRMTFPSYSGDVFVDQG